MSTFNFSAPDDTRNAFNATFESQKKSAVVAELMREAVERAQSQQRSKDAYHRIFERRQHLIQVNQETEGAENRLLSTLTRSCRFKRQRHVLGQYSIGANKGSQRCLQS